MKKLPRLDLNASSAERWTTCTASPKFILENNDRLPPDNRTYSDQGNTAHEVAAALLQNREIDHRNCPVLVEPEMHTHAWNYMEYVESFRQPGSILLVEQKYDLFYMEGRHCYVDAAVINSDSLHVIDYKYGEGVKVSPDRNKQLSIYAKSVLYHHVWPTVLPDNFPVFVHIYQPRTRDDEPHHVWETTKGEIESIAKSIKDIASNIITQQDYDTPFPLVFVPSEKACQFCPAKGFCEARGNRFLAEIPDLSILTKGGDESCSTTKCNPQAKQTQVARTTVESKATATFQPDPVATNKQQVAIIEHGEAIKKWVDDQYDYILTQMKSGALKVPGYKLVLSRGGNRAWSDPDKAGELLVKELKWRDEVYSEKLISVKQAEDKLGKHKFSPELDALIFKPPGNPIIVPESDKREAIGGALAEIEVLE